MAPASHRDDDLDHVTRELRTADPERAFLLAFAPRRLRPVLTMLAALDLEAGRILDRVREPAAALMRIAWWQEAVDDALAGRPAAQPLLRLLAGLRAHPALAPAVDLKAIVAAREAFLHEEGEMSLDEAITCARATGGLLNRLWAQALLRAGGGPASERSADWLVAAEDVGTAYQLTRYLGGIQREARAGRLWLPGLRAADRAAIPARQVSRGPWPPLLTDLLRALAGSAEALCAAAVARLPARLPLAARQPFLLSAYVARDIAALAAARYDPSAARLGRLGPREIMAVWRLYLFGLAPGMRPEQPKP